MLNIKYKHKYKYKNFSVDNVFKDIFNNLSNDFLSSDNLSKDLSSDILSKDLSSDILSKDLLFNNLSKDLLFNNLSKDLLFNNLSKDLLFNNLSNDLTNSIINIYTVDVDDIHIEIINEEKLFKEYNIYTNIMDKTLDEIANIQNQFSHIRERLIVLTKLEAGQKIWMSTDPKTNVIKFEIDNNSIFAPIYRKWGEQSRENTINAIIDDTNFIQVNFKYLQGQAIRDMTNLINGSIQGIKNLKFMYSGNNIHDEAFNNIISVLTKLTYV
jgi:hypothetical protein